jgi:hypothetical protein
MRMLSCCVLALVAEAPVGPEGGPVAAANAPLSCGEIADCADRCGAQCPGGARRVPCLYQCRKHCRNAGCDSARPRFDSVTNCILARCLIPCSKGPGPACRNCTERHCSARIGRCREHRCEAAAGMQETRTR